METQTPPTHLRPPGQDRGLRDVFANRFLLKLIVDKEIQIRYRGTVLGLLWSYLKPGVQFLVFYIAMGVFLDLNRGIENFAVYLFSGIVVMNLFGEVFGNASRSVVANGGLLKKIYLPRQLFPVSNLLVAFVHFVPQLVILLLACLLTGWSPGIKQLLAVIVGTLIISLFSLALGMLFATFNVFFRDAEHIVDRVQAEPVDRGGRAVPLRILVFHDRDASVLARAAPPPHGVDPCGHRDQPHPLLPRGQAVPLPRGQLRAGAVNHV